MKWLALINLSLLFSNVAALGLVLQSQTIVGGSSLVLWTRDPTDPTTMDFDLRFVHNLSDVGLALANLRMNADDQYGTVSVQFPSAGQYVLKAVTGSPRNTVVATSNEIAAISPAPTTTILLTTTLSPSASPTVTIRSTTFSTLAPIEAMGRKKNVPAIIGGVIGALLFLGLLSALIVYVSRRRASIDKRWSFHADKMVRRRLSRAHPSTIIPDMVEVPPPTRPEDVEQGLPSSVPRPLPSGHVVPSPRGPRPSIKRTQHITIITSPITPLEPAPLRTRRQQEIADRIRMLRGQIVQLRDQPDTGHVLDDMQRQMVWLKNQEQSPWALHQTDVLPAGYARYMTP